MSELGKKNRVIVLFSELSLAHLRAITRWRYTRACVCCWFCEPQVDVEIEESCCSIGCIKAIIVEARSDWVTAGST